MANTFLQLPENLTLKQLASYVGSNNVGRVLNVNGLNRTRNLSSVITKQNEQLVLKGDDVSWKRKAEILNNFSTDSDVFEYACVQSEDGWKILSQTMRFQDAISIPADVEIVRYDDVLGNEVPVTKTVYNKVMKSLESTGKVNSSLFNDFSTVKPSTIRSVSTSSTRSNALFQAFRIPWGDITFYSSLSDKSIDIPVYPESIKEPRTASYSTMPDTLYQYEPWYTYNSSGPRNVSFEFHMHRQMWTGDERDGKANELVRFLQASTYPKYSGSAVNSDTCTLYVKGQPYITGIVSSVDVDWTGPIGLDGFYLEFTVTVSFTEVSTRALSHDVVQSLSLLG